MVDTVPTGVLASMPTETMTYIVYWNSYAVASRTMCQRITPDPGQTTATRDQKAKHRPVDVAGSRRETSPAGERKECRSRRPVREGASSQRHQARAPSAPPPTAPADTTVQPPRRTRVLPHILAGVFRARGRPWTLKPGSHCRLSTRQVFLLASPIAAS